MTEHKWFSPKMLFNGLVALLLLAVLSMGVLMFHPGKAHAASLLECTTTVSVSFSPGVTNTAQTISTTANFTLSCPATLDSTLTGGTMEISGSLSLACDRVEPNFSDTPTIHWNNGNTSAIDLGTNTVTSVDSTATDASSGTDTGGTETQLDNSSVTVAIEGLSLDLTGCDTSSGVPSGSGTGTITFA